MSHKHLFFFLQQDKALQGSQSGKPLSEQLDLVGRAKRHRTPAITELLGLGRGGVNRVPLDQTVAVGVAGLDEVDPVCIHGLGNGKVLSLVRVVHVVQVVLGVLNLSHVGSTGGLSWRGVVPQVSVDGGSAVGREQVVGPELRANLGAVGEHGVVGRRGGCAIVGRVGLQELIDPITRVGGVQVGKVRVEGDVESVAGAALVTGVAGHDGDILGEARDEGVEVGVGNGVVIQRGLEGGLGGTGLASDVESRRGQSAQAGNGGAVHRLHKGGAVSLGALGALVALGKAEGKRVVRITNTGLDDGTNNLALGQRGVEDVVGGGGSSRLAGDRDVVWVSTKGLNVVADPLQGGELVQLGVVTGAVDTGGSQSLGIQLGVDEVAGGAVTVVVVDKHNALVSHAATVETGVRVSASGRVGPHHNGELVASGVGGGIDIEVQAVLTEVRVGGTARDTSVTKLLSIQGLVPWGNGLRRLEAVFVGRVSTEGNALPDTNAPPVGQSHVDWLFGETCVALDGAIDGLDDRLEQGSIGCGCQRSSASGDALGAHIRRCVKLYIYIYICSEIF